MSYRLLIGMILVLVTVAGCAPATDRMPVTNTPESLATVSLTTATSVPIQTWVQIYGEDQENMGSDVLQAADGGYFIVGGASQAPGSRQYGGVYLLRTDIDGQVLWQKVYGGKEYDAGWSAVQVQDGGLVIAGDTASFGAGGMDAYLIKVDQDGNELWSKTFGTALDEQITSVRQTLDGGFLLVGDSVDPKDIVADPGAAGYAGLAGRSNIYLVRTDRDGNSIWSKAFASQDNIIASTGFATLDGGFVILATILYYPKNDNDIYLLKVNANGDEVWSRTWQEGALSGYDMIQTSDGSLVITGFDESSDPDASDILLVKVDAKGNELWRNHFGKPNIYEMGDGVIETSTGNYVVLGSSVRSLYSGNADILLVSVDKDGKLLWQKVIDIPYLGKTTAILQHPDGGYVITGYAMLSNQMQATILIKTDAEGNVDK
jgi:hypothetical protein